MELRQIFTTNLFFIRNSKEKRINELTDDEILKIREYIDQNFKVEGFKKRLFIKHKKTY